MFYKIFSFLHRVYENVRTFIYRCFDYREPFERNFRVTDEERKYLYSALSKDVLEKYRVEIYPSFRIKLVNKGLEGKLNDE